MNKSSLSKYLTVNLIMVALEIISLILVLAGVLSLGDGFEGRNNTMVFIALILTQLIFLYLTRRVDDNENQKRLFMGQIILFVVVLVWIISVIGIP